MVRGSTLWSPSSHCFKVCRCDDVIVRGEGRGVRGRGDEAIIEFPSVSVLELALLYIIGSTALVDV